MADSNQDINLRIRAKDYSQKTLKQLKKTIDGLTAAQRDQQSAAERGESSARDLEKSYQDLERATKAMVRQAADIKAFEDQKAALEGARTATANAQEAVQEYSRKLAGKTKVTAAENKELKSLEKEMRSAEKTEQRQAARYEQLEDRLKQYGISTKDTKSALSDMSTYVSKSNESLRKQEDAVEANEKAIKRLAEAEKQASDAQLAENIERQRKQLAMAAKDALSAADGWRTAAVSSKAYGDAATPVSAALNKIMGVSSPVGKSIGQIGSEMAALSKEANTANGPIDGLKEKIKQLSDAEHQITKSAGLVDTFNRQVEAVKAARQAYSQAQADVKKYAQELAGAGDDAKTVQGKLNAAQQALSKSTKGYREVADAAQETRAQLRALGIDTRSTETAQQQLVATIDKVVAAENALGDAVKRAEASGASSQADELARIGDAAAKAAVGSRSLNQSITPLADSISSIIDPSKQANSTLSKMEDNAELMAAAFSTIRKPVEDATKKFNDLAKVQSAIQKTAGLIDTFSRQTKAVGQARDSYREAKNRLDGLVATMRSGEPVTDAIRKQTQEAAKAVKDAADAYRLEADRARVTQHELRQLGIDTTNLASAQERLSGAARNSTSAEKSLSDAVSEYGKKSKMASDQSAGAAKIAGDALSKLKGEVIGLTGAYLSLHGAMSEMNDVLDIAAARQKFFSQVSLAVGKDVKAQGAEWDFVNKLSTRWGLNMEDTAKSYAKFAVTVKESGYSVKDAKALFENISIYAKANNLSEEEIGRVFYAVDQMLSQGQMTTAELKQQLGNVLPGIFETAAIKLNGTTRGFQKQLSAGVFESKAIFELFDQLGTEAMESADKASNGLISAQSRLKNAKDQFDLKIADSGFIDTYTNLIKKLTEILSSDKANKAAEALGAAFSKAADAAVFLVDHIDAVIGILKGLAAIMISKSIVGFAGTVSSITKGFWATGKELATTISSMKTVTAEMGIMGGATTVLTKAFGFLGRALPFIGWGVMITEVISSLWNMSSTVRDIGWSIMKTFKTAFDYVSNIIHGNYKSWRETAADAEQWAKEHRSEEDKERLYSEKKPDNAPKKDAAAPGRVSENSDLHFTDADKRAEALRKETEKNDKLLADESRRNAHKSAKQDLQERINLVKGEYAPKLKEAMEVANTKVGAGLYKTIREQESKAIDLETKKWQVEVGNKSAEAGKKRAEKIKELSDALKAKSDSMDNRDNTLNASPDNYGEREQKAVDAQLDKYRELEAQSRKLGGAENQRFQAQIAGLKEGEAGMVRQRYQLAEMERYNKTIKGLEDSRNSQLNALQAQYDAHQLTEKDYVEQVNAIYDQSKDKILEAAQAAREFGEAHKDAFTNDAAFQKFVSDNDAYQTKIKASGNQLMTYQKQAAQGLSESVNVGFSALVDNITAATQGTQSLGEAFQNTAAAMLQYFAQLLQKIAMTIIQAAIMNALLGGAPSAAGSTGGAKPPVDIKAAAMVVGKNHKGGMAGSSGIGAMRVSPSVFANAQRYHTGGMVGLQPDEVPIVAQEGEEVLTRDDPRNRLNGGAANSTPQDIRIVAVDDQRSAVTEMMKTPEGTQALMTCLRQNLSTVKKMIK